MIPPPVWLEPTDRGDDKALGFEFVLGFYRCISAGSVSRALWRLKADVTDLLFQSLHSACGAVRTSPVIRPLRQCLVPRAHGVDRISDTTMPPLAGPQSMNAPIDAVTWETDITDKATRPGITFYIDHVPAGYTSPLQSFSCYFSTCSS